LGHGSHTKKTKRLNATLQLDVANSSYIVLQSILYTIETQVSDDPSHGSPHSPYAH
jgi:hypothetical protein